MNTQNRSIVLLPMVVVLTLLASCGAPQLTATTVPTPEPPVVPKGTPPASSGTIAGVVMTFPTGTFAAKDGDWVLTFDDDGGFTFSESGTVAASGTYSVQADELTWESDSYCGNAELMKATYTWTFESDTLLFQVKGKDSCADRQAVLDSISYEIWSDSPTAALSTERQPPLGAETEWDLVVIGDSSLWGLAKAFSARIEADVGVKVVSHDCTVGGLSAGRVLEALETGESSNPKLAAIPDLLRDAEVVVMFANPEDSMDPEKLADLDPCFHFKTAGPCSPESFEKYAADLAAIWAKILELRDGQPTVLRATDIYNPLVSPWKKLGDFAGCTACWENMCDAARQAAEAQNIPFLSRYDDFNGANHDEDPREKGYIAPDGEHPSALMSRHTAELLSEMGYQPVSLGSSMPQRLAETPLPETLSAASSEPTAVTKAENAATAIAESGDTTWDMVVLGDSLLAEDWGTLPEAYAARIEEDLGIEVEIQNWAVGGETTRSLLFNVQRYPWCRDPLQEAEVILISAGGGDLPRMEKRFFGGECGGADNQDCLRQQLEESEENWDALLTEITSLADPRETLIRPIIPGVLEYFARVYKSQPEDVEVYNSYVVALYEHMAQSSAERGIPVLDLYAMHDGPNADPSLPEIAGTGDGVHVSNEGDAVIADLLRDLGYDFAKP